MYQVNLGNNILYYPGSDDAMILETELNEEIGIAGEFTFKVPAQNPLYSQLAQGELVTIYKDGVEFWRGEIRDINTDFLNIARVYCLEDLAWLGNEYMEPALIDNETYAQRFQAAITAYNANRSADRQFSVGYITNVTSSNDCLWKTEYEWSILDSLRTCICGDNGYIRVRRVTSGGTVTRYIDIVTLADYGVQATQPIQYGYNLLDYVKESDYSNLVNVLTPYGAELEAEVYDGYVSRLQGTTITESTSVTAYGRHAKAVVFDNVADLTTLNSLAAAYLTRYCQPQLTMEVKAIDLADIENVNEIKIGDSVRIVAEPFAIDQWLYLTQIRRDLQNLEKNIITLSGHVQGGRTITSQTISTSEALKNLPTKASVLDAAKKNAIEILNGVDGGYVTFVTNADDQITELRIANNIDFDQATKAWRWNVGGLAYMSRATVSDDWTIGVAATMDGGIVADFITTGYMLADRIKGGTLTLGGFNNIDGTFSICDASNVEKVHGDNVGIKVGATTGSKIFINTDGELQYFYDNAYMGKIRMRPNVIEGQTVDMLRFEDFDYVRVGADKEVIIHGDDEAWLSGQNVALGTTMFPLIDPNERQVTVDAENVQINAYDDLYFQFGTLHGLSDEYWHTWAGQQQGTWVSTIVLGVGVTQAVFPDINRNYAYDPYIQCADGVDAPLLEGISYSGTNCTVTFTAVTAAQAGSGGDSCVIRLLTKVIRNN